MSGPAALAPSWPAAAPRPAAGRGTATDTLLCALLGVFVATLVAEGPLRWAAALADTPNLPYLRDAIPAGSLAVLLLRSLVLRRWLDLPVLLAVGALGLHAAVGLVQGLAPFQVALGFKTFMYLPYGMAMWPLLHDRWPTVVRAALAVYVVTLAGLALNFAFGPMPWEGVRYETAFGAVATTWRWWLADGIPRLPGFARVSFAAAMLLGLSALLAIAGLRRLRWRVLVALLAFAGLLLTTSKGMLLAFPLAAAWLLLPGGQGHARAGRWMVRGLCAFGLALPVAAMLLDLRAGLPPDGWPAVAHTAWERFSEFWPAALDLLPPGLAALPGAGLGAIGTPQLFGHHPHWFHPADSLAVYLLVDFGLAGAAYYLLPAIVLGRAAAGLPDPAGRACVAVLVVAYGYGMVISMVEETFFATVLGAALGALVMGLANRPASR